MFNILVYTRPQCHFCQKLKGFLDEEGLSYEEINVAKSPEHQAEMESKVNGVGSVPQLFVGDRHIGDCFTVLSEAGQEKLAQALADSSSRRSKERHQS